MPDESVQASSPYTWHPVPWIPPVVPSNWHRTSGSSVANGREGRISRCTQTIRRNRWTGRYTVMGGWFKQTCWPKQIRGPQLKGWKMKWLWLRYFFLASRKRSGSNFNTKRMCQFLFRYPATKNSLTIWSPEVSPSVHQVCRNHNSAKQCLSKRRITRKEDRGVSDRPGVSRNVYWWSRCTGKHSRFRWNTAKRNLGIAAREGELMRSSGVPGLHRAVKHNKYKLAL